MSDDNNDIPSKSGRGEGGRFAKGNPGGPGSPVARHARQLRERLDDALFKICSTDRLTAAVDAILKLAEAGDTQAAKLLFERIAGPPIAASVMERIEALEAALQQDEKEPVDELR